MSDNLPSDPVARNVFLEQLARHRAIMEAETGREEQPSEAEEYAGLTLDQIRLKLHGREGLSDHEVKQAEG